jgi:hypothetical protein
MGPVYPTCHGENGERIDKSQSSRPTSFFSLDSYWSKVGHHGNWFLQLLHFIFRPFGIFVKSEWRIACLKKKSPDDKVYIGNKDYIWT